jgi:hypothetical protein
MTDRIGILRITYVNIMANVRVFAPTQATTNQITSKAPNLLITFNNLTEGLTSQAVMAPCALLQRQR